MTRSEVKDILIKRVAFKGQRDLPESGMYYENEHSIVTVNNIQSTADCDVSLLDLEESVIYQVINDVFRSDEVSSCVMDCNAALFDNLILKMMSIRVINLILTSTRSNSTERITKEIASSIRFDLTGNYGSNASRNFPVTMGLYDKYNDELLRVRQILNKNRFFKTMTIG